MVLETNLDGMLDATKNYLSVTDSDYALDATLSDGSLDTPACTGVCIHVVAVFLYTLLRTKFIFVRKTKTCARHFAHFFNS